MRFERPQNPMHDLVIDTQPHKRSVRTHGDLVPTANSDGLQHLVIDRDDAGPFLWRLPRWPAGMLNRRDISVGNGEYGVLGSVGRRDAQPISGEGQPGIFFSPVLPLRENQPRSKHCRPRCVCG